MKTLHRSIGSLLSAALTLPPLSALADVVPPPSMLPDASNAALPGTVKNLGLLDTGGNYYKFGTGVYPLYQTATATTANTTNGSPTITVASAANIAINDEITASFAPASAYVTGIVGTTVTMSGNAIATGTGTAVTFGVNRFSAGSSLLTNTLASRNGLFGAASAGRSNWVDNLWGGGDPGPSVFSISPYGGDLAGLFAARSSDNTSAPSQNTIALAVLSIADATGSGHNVWGQYIEGHTLASGTVTAYMNEESSVVNGWTAAANDPYGVNTAGLVTNLRLDVGIGSGVTNNATDALEIINNGGSYKAGITLSSDALDTSGGAAAALALAQNQGVFWYSGAGNAAWKLYSTSTSGNNAIVLSDAAGLDEAAPGLSLRSTSGFYGLALTPSTGTGGSPYIELDGIGASATKPLSNFTGRAVRWERSPRCRAPIRCGS